MKILVTGNEGYIGTHLTKLLPGAEGRDLKSGQDYRSLSGRTWDVVVHLAAFVSVMESFARPLDYFENNYVGLHALLGKNAIGRFVFVSTGGAMYGDRILAQEQDARYSLCLSPYAQSKHLAEGVAAQHPNQCVLRLANVFGGDATVRGEAAVHSHFQQDNPIVLYGGEQTRDFIHINAVCQAILAAAHGTMRGTYNIGSGVETNIGDLARLYAHMRGVPLEVRPARPGEVQRITLDCSNAKEVGLL